MRVFAIGDLHLDGGEDKPMNIFGDQWEGHFEKISEDWLKRVGQDDLVLIPGDISWAMQLENAIPDLQRIAALPGSKVLLRGNHDYWWPGIGRLRSVLPEGMYAVQNDALHIGGITVAGTRGWMLPGMGLSADDERIYRRELMRLGLSLDHAARLGGTLVVMTHYPPLAESGDPTEVTRMIDEAGASWCVYGHLHGPSCRTSFHGMLNGTSYACVSCDQLDFSLFELPLSENGTDVQ